MKYLAMDIGNVLTHLNFSNFIIKLSKLANIPKEEAWYFLERTQALHDLGITNLEREVRDRFGVRSEYTVDDVKNEWNNTITPNKIVINWALDLLENKNTKIILTSNIGSEHAALMKDVLAPIYKHKNIIKFFSCWVGARKPSFLYFRAMLDQYPEFNNCVYLDDRPENIKTGNWLKLRGIQFDLSIPELQNEENIKNKLKEIEVLI